MKWISIILIIFLIGCGTANPIRSLRTFKTFHKTDTVKLYIPIQYVPPELTAKIEKLEKENYLLRVEIDRLKAEAVNMHKLFEIKRATGNIQENLNKLKKELCDD